MTAHAYRPDACSQCGNFTLVREGDHFKCDTCGAVPDRSATQSDPKKPVLVERLGFGAIAEH